MRGSWKWLLLGLFGASMLGLTTEEIFNNVYDSANVALRGNIVVGGGGGGNTPTPQPTATPQPTPTVVPTATPQATPTPRSPVYRSLVTGGTTNQFSTVGGNNFGSFGNSVDTGATQSNFGVPIPIAATIKNLSVFLTSAPGSGNSWTVTLWSGTCGSETSQALTCTVSNTAQTCQDNSHSVSISANQCALFNTTSGVSPTATRLHASAEADY